MLQPKVYRTNDSSNAVLNNNQVLENNPTSVVEINSSEKEITNAEEQQESGLNDNQSETSQIFENLNSTENFSEPDFDISNSIDTAKELPLSKPQSSANPDVKKITSPNWYHIKCVFLILISPLLKMGGFVKYVVHFLMETQVKEVLLTNQEN